MSRPVSPSVVDVRGRASVTLAQLVEGGVGGDPVRPRRERRAAVEAGEAAHDRDHRLLGGVVGVSTGTGDPPADRVHPVVVPAQQGVEGVTIAGLGGGDERSVVGGSRSVRIALAPSAGR